MYYEIKILLIILYVINSYVQSSPESEIDTLKLWIQKTENVTTLKSLTTSTHTNLNEQNPLIEPATKRTIKSLSAVMDDRVRNITCTYVILAQKHLVQLNKIVDNEVALQEISSVVTHIKQSYLNVTLKMATTISKIGYSSPPWITKLISFLKNDVENKVLDGLADLIVDLLEYHTKSNCQVPKLNLDNLYTKINVMHTLSFEAEKLLTLNFIDAVYNAHTMPVGEWLTKHNIPKYIRTEYHSQYYTPTSVIGPNNDEIKNNRLCGTYVYHLLKQVMQKVYYNILDTQFILDQNKSILNFSGFDEFEPDSLNKLLSKTEIITDSPQETNEKFLNLLSLKSKVVSIMSNKIWYSTFASRIDELNEGSTNLNNAIRFSSFSFKLKSSMNYIMDKLHEKYLNCTLVHFKETLLVLEYIQLIQKKDYKKNTDLILCYYEITLKIIASFHNNNFKIPEWMFLVIFYMKDMKDFVVNDKVEDIDTLISKTKTIIKMLKTFHSKLNPKNNKPPMLDIKIIQSDNNNKIDQMHIPIVRELYLFIITDSLRMSYAGNIYHNLIRVTFLLDIHSETLHYNNYSSFNIPLWKPRLSVKLFRWDELENVVFKNSYKTNTDRISLKIRIEKLTNPDHDKLLPTDEINHSLNIYNNIKNLAQIVIIRYSLGILSQCHNANRVLNDETVLVKPNNAAALRTKFEQYCGISGKFFDNFKSFFKAIGMIDHRLPNLLLVEIEKFRKSAEPIFESKYMDLKLINNAVYNDIFKNTFVFAVKNLNELAIKMNMFEIYNPIVPMKTDTPKASSVKADASFDVAYMSRAQKLVTGIDSLLDKLLVFRNYFIVHKCLMESIGLYRPLPIE